MHWQIFDRSGALNQVTLSTSLNAMEIASAWQMALVILGSPALGLMAVGCPLSAGSFLRSTAMISKYKKLYREQFIALAEGSYLLICVIDLMDDCNL